MPFSIQQTTFRQTVKDGLRFADDLLASIAGNFEDADLSIFHQFAPPPAGGGHQFLRAFWQESAARG